MLNLFQHPIITVAILLINSNNLNAKFITIFATYPDELVINT